MTPTIGGFRGGAEGAAAPPLFKVFLHDSTHSNRPGSRFIKCSLILSSEMLTLLYFASRICPQCCMLHVLKSEVFIRGEGCGGLGPLFLNFLDLPLPTAQNICTFFILFNSFDLLCFTLPLQKGIICIGTVL